MERLSEKNETDVVDLDDLGDELGHDGLVGHLKGVDELDAAVDVLDVLALEERAARHLKTRAVVGAAAAAVSVLAYGVDAHARLEALGETARRTPLTVRRRYIALARCRRRSRRRRHSSRRCWRRGRCRGCSSGGTAVRRLTAARSRRHYHSRAPIAILHDQIRARVTRKYLFVCFIVVTNLIFPLF